MAKETDLYKVTPKLKEHVISNEGKDGYAEFLKKFIKLKEIEK